MRNIHKFGAPVADKFIQSNYWTGNCHMKGAVNSPIHPTDGNSTALPSKEHVATPFLIPHAVAVKLKSQKVASQQYSASTTKWNSVFIRKPS